MSVWSRFTALFRSRQLDAALDDEMRSHLEMRIEHNLAAGMKRDAAERDAYARFGNRALMKEDTRRADILPSLESLWQDVRFGARMLRKSPGFTAVAVLTLALGIGGNTAIFTLTHALLLRSLPVANPDELVRLTFSNSKMDYGLSGPMFDELRKRNQVFSGMAAWNPRNLNVTDNGETRKLRGALASGDAFTTLGVKPALGRLFTAADDLPRGGSDGWVAVISEEFWQARFHRSLSALGSVLNVEGTPATIVGVMPRGFEGTDIGTRPEIVVPLEFPWTSGSEKQRHSGTTLWLTLMGRLRPGIDLAQARADVERLAPGILLDTDPKGLLRRGFWTKTKMGVAPGRTGRAWVRDQYRQPLLALQALVGVILLVCCANLAGLMVARASARRHEFAVRAALGAARARMLRQLIVEGALLATLAAALGLLFAHWATAAIVAALMRRNALLLDLSPDLGVLVFTTAVAIFAALVCGLPSGLRAARIDPMSNLKQGWQTLAGRTRLEGLLVAGQVALAAMLLVAAGLFSGTLYRLLAQHPGFATEDVVLIPTELKGVPAAQSVARYEQIVARLQQSPGVDAVTAESIPLLSEWESSLELKAILPDGSERRDSPYFNRVGPRYFATAGTRVLAGRDVAETDRAGQPDACWVNQSAAANYFPGRSAIGGFLRDSEAASADIGCTVAGVVEDTKYKNMRDAVPRIVYMPFMQLKGGVNGLHLLLRTRQPEAAVASARRVLADLVPGAPLLDAISMRRVLHDSVGREEVLTMITGFFAALGMLLTVVGLYGLLSYRVAGRTRELGVRMALGAPRGEVLGLVIRQAIGLTLTGLLAGLLLSLPLARWVASLLFNMRPLDVPTFAGAAILLLLTAVIASWLPARRAARVDLSVALRYE